MKRFNLLPNKIIVSVLAFLFLYTINTSAGDRKQVYDKTQKMYIFLGKWEGTGKLNIGDKAIDVKVKFDITKNTDGWGLTLNQTIEAEGMDSYKSTSLLGYQPGHEHIHLFKVSNYGETYDFYGYWLDDKNYELKYEGLMDSKPHIEMMTINFKGQNSFDYSSETHKAWEKISSMKITFKKVS